MAYKPSLTSDEWNALQEPARGFYKLVGANYVPDIEGIDNLPGLEGAYRTEKQKREDFEKALKRFEGVDPDKYQQLLTLEQSQEVGKLAGKGEYDKAKQLIESQATEKITAAEKRAAEKMIVSQLTVALSQAGVLPERLEDAMEVTRKLVRLAKDDTLEVIGKDGQPTGVDFAKFVKEDLRAAKPWYYAPANATGTGAENDTNGNPAGVDIMKLSATQRLDHANKQSAAAAATAK